MPEKKQSPRPIRPTKKPKEEEEKKFPIDEDEFFKKVEESIDKAKEYMERDDKEGE